jgi:Na+-transporting methylmalonyl-CoA/oxaloacetate decarboxylase gamma subunit
MNPADTDRDVLPTSTGIDRSIGYLAVGLGVVFLFALAIMGMSRMERISSNAAQTTARPNETAPASEIGGEWEPPAVEEPRTQ